MYYGIFTKNRNTAENLIKHIKQDIENGGEDIIEYINTKKKIILRLNNDISYEWYNQFFSYSLIGWRFDGAYIDMTLNYDDIMLIYPFIHAQKEDIHIFNNTNSYKISELRDKLNILQALYGDDLYVQALGNLDYDFYNEFNENLVDQNLGTNDNPVKN